MNPSLNYFVQIIKTEHQLTEAMELRYRVYKKTYPKIVEHLTQPYETDYFDSRSIHIGLYCNADGVTKLAGYCRLILPEYFKGGFDPFLVKSHPFYNYETFDVKHERFHFLKLLPFDKYNELNDYCKQMEAKNYQCTDVSRFLTDDEHRSISLTIFFAKSMFAIAQNAGIKFAFFSCDEHHAAFYKKLGLTLYEKEYSCLNKLFQRREVIFGTDLSLSFSLQTSIKDLRLQLETKKQIIYKKAA